MATREDFILRNRAVDGVSATLRRIKANVLGLSRSLDRSSKKAQKLANRFRGLTNAFKRAGTRMKTVGRSMTVGLTLPIAAVGGAIFRTSLSFGKAMNRVNALTQRTVGVVNPLFNDLKDTAKKLGAETAFSASEVAEGMGFLAQAGFEADEILKAIGPTLDLAAAGNLGLAETADIASNIMGAFSIEADKMGHVSDVLALTTARTNTNLSQLGEAMQDAAPIAQKFGASIEETSALIGLLGNVGIQGSKAGTTLKAMFTRLAAPSAKARDLLGAVGVTVEDKVTGKIKTLTQILGELGPQLGKLNKKDQLAVINELFGLRGIAGASELLAKSIDKGQNPIVEMINILKATPGAAEGMRKTMEEGLPGAMAKFKAAFEAAALAIAESGLLEVVTDILKMFSAFFSKVSKQSPALLKLITILALIVGVMGPLLVVAGSIASAISALIPIFVAVGAAGAAMAFAIGFIITGFLFTLVKWADAVIEAWDDLPLFFSEMWKNIKRSFMSGASSIAQIVAGVIPGGQTLINLAKSIGLVGESDAEKQEREISEKRQKLLAKIEAKRFEGRLDVNVNAPKGTRTEGSASGGILNILSTGTLGTAQ